MLKEAVPYSIVEGESVRLLQVTDPHLFADPESQLLGVNTANSLRAVLDDYVSTGFSAHMMLATGDISQDYSPESYRHFVSAISPLDLPCHFLPGNHDDPRLMNLHMQGTRIYGHKRILIGNWQILMLDSTVRGKPGGYMSTEEMAIITSAIAAEPHRNVLLVMHHNPVLVNCTWLDQHCMANGADFLAKMAMFPQVRGLLWGHVHQALDRNYPTGDNSMRLLATPSTCIQFKPLSPYFALDGLQPGYRLLELNPDGSIHTNVHRVPGNRFSPDNEASGY